ncbi:MAG: arylsulfatase [Kordiimonadaceae bacterium]|nr:arylsulfatase [Kordiimonadaceae bacterium]
MRKIIITASICYAVSLFTVHAAELPNIVLIMADDMGSGDIEAYNQASKVPTPHLNELANEGMRFTDAHSPSAVCSPTRYGLLTGRYAWRTSLKKGVLNGYSSALIDKDRSTLGSLMKEEGYATAVIGKWHLGLGTAEETNYSAPLDHSPIDLGFDYFYGIPASLDMAPYLYVKNDRPDVALSDKTTPLSHLRRDGGDGFWRAGLVADGFKHEEVLDRLTVKAVEYIEEQSAEESKPFFLYLPLSAPHTPWMPREDFMGKSGAGYYGDFAAQVDWTVGQVLNTLEKTGITDNTLVIFTSDNGAHWNLEDIEKYGHLANRPWRGQKADIHEGGHRVPFIVKWPGKVIENSQSDHLLTLTDMMATLAALNGRELKENEGEDSYNILPAILSEEFEVPVRADAIHHSLDGMFAIRKGKWKLIEQLGSGGFTQPAFIDAEVGEAKGQLYDLETDPAETTNVYLENPAVVEELTTLLNEDRDSGRSR